MCAHDRILDGFYASFRDFGTQLGATWFVIGDEKRTMVLNSPQGE